jgi:3alpha(or 20beta)-hydroxysteroid dehydrogenase
MTGLDGKVVVITGGARGMGAAYVRGFLAEGAKVVAANLSWDGVEASVMRSRPLAGCRW